ncbi:MAG: sigma-54-dependent Fis family transcriptional regulator [Deltaproteobacteria bacterium]|nr:sigma-54-dependent Fis family transcriptional regulator [Deltaproteobacteria bacterium]
MMDIAGNNILWTAGDFRIPQGIWKKLEGTGFKVHIAEDDSDLTEKIKNLSPRLWVGRINGNSETAMALLREIKRLFPLMSVIIMSKTANTDDAIAAIRNGAYDYLSGDVSGDRLWSAMEGALKYPVMPGVPQSRKMKEDAGERHMIAVNSSMTRIMDLARKIARGRSTVLINGETGVGKEVMARFMHENSDRKDAPFIAVNCAALPESLLESELFGHEKGAFTGAISRKKGKFELADGGTLLLDEISEMDVSIQAKLLRVLQEREIDRVGGQGAIPVDTRVIATTNRDLEAEIKNGNFRLDLYYRLNVVPIKLPPLRERTDDIPPLAEFFLKKHCDLNNTALKRLAPDAEAFLKGRIWPGNVREFENLLERATLLVEQDVITAADLESISNPEEQGRAEALNDYNLIPLREMERMMIMKALDNHKGNRTHAAGVLGISVRTLRNKLHEYEAGIFGEEDPSED